MKKDCPFQTKQEMRKSLLQRRAALSQTRRQEASSALTAYLLTFCQQFSYVLSFASLPTEIDLWPLNAQLAKEKKLLLPKVVEETLQIFHVEHLDHLVPSKLAIKEPSDQSLPFDAQKIPCVLVPGLGFNLEKERIGYGRGHYDRFLQQLPNALKVGVGFREQFITDLPCEAHDQKLDAILFF